MDACETERKIDTTIESASNNADIHGSKLVFVDRPREVKKSSDAMQIDATRGAVEVTVQCYSAGAIVSDKP